MYLFEHFNGEQRVLLLRQPAHIADDDPVPVPLPAADCRVIGVLRHVDGVVDDPEFAVSQVLLAKQIDAGFNGAGEQRRRTLADIAPGAGTDHRFHQPLQARTVRDSRLRVVGVGDVYRPAFQNMSHAGIHIGIAAVDVDDVVTVPVKEVL